MKATFKYSQTQSVAGQGFDRLTDSVQQTFSLLCRSQLRLKLTTNVSKVHITSVSMFSADVSLHLLMEKYLIVWQKARTDLLLPADSLFNNMKR